VRPTPPERWNESHRGSLPEAVWTCDAKPIVAMPASAGSAFMFVVQYLSVVSASLIVLFGALSSGLLVVLYIFVRLNRRARIIGHRLKRKSTPLVQN